MLSATPPTPKKIPPTATCIASALSTKATLRLRLISSICSDKRTPRPRSARLPWARTPTRTTGRTAAVDGFGAQMT